MKIDVLASGSSGNAYRVEFCGVTLLLECGLPFKKLQKLLGYKVREIDGCLITHEHMDHAKAVKDLMKHGVDCYMTKGTAEALDVEGHRLNIFGIDSANAKEISYCWKFFNSLQIMPFQAVHDVREPVSFFIQDRNTGESLVFITDTAYVKYRLPPMDYLMVECNYVKQTMDQQLKDGKIHVSLRNRIVRNHMSLETLLEMLKVTDLSRLKKIYVLHLSDSNSDAGLIEAEIRKLTGKEVVIC